MHKIYFTISFISCLYMFRAHVLIITRSKLLYTASGIITPIGVMQFWPPDDEHTYRCEWYQRMCNAILTSWWWAHVLETCRRMKWNLVWNKFCASSWLNTEINILRCTVSKTSKLNGNAYVDLQIIFEFVAFPWPTRFLFWYETEN